MKRWPHGPVVLSVAIHIGVAAALMPALLDPRYLDRLFSSAPEREGVGDRIVFVATPAQRPGAAAITPRATVRTRPQAQLVAAPRVAEPVPTYAPASAAIAGAAPARTGSGAGGDPTDSGRVALVPASADPRIWNAPAAYVPTSPSQAKSLEGSLGRAIARANDSIAGLGVQNVRPDWVIGRDGRRFGVANDRIYLGKAELPAVALGMLPIPGFGCMPKMFFPDRAVRDSVGIICMQLENPGVAERAERIDQMSAEIRARAPLTIAAREEIARIAMRKDRERTARLRAQQRAPATPPPSSMRESCR